MTTTAVLQRRAVRVRGIVQGVGFRPFVYTLARRHGLAGVVWNDAGGVGIEIEGPQDDLDAFLHDLTAAPPPLARVEAVTWHPVPAQGGGEFHIETSRGGVGRSALVSPDVATCAQCLAELFDPADRRYRYPFINCTNCGPRFTITRDVPYDRSRTTMAGFSLCSACRQEYEDPANRRFHAQPNACPVCGPRVRLLDRDGHEVLEGDDPIALAATLLRAGMVLAVKGLGGYHLACNPSHAGAVRSLRARKARRDKPFALMVRDLEQAQMLCDVSAAEAELLTSPARPIVLLPRRKRPAYAIEEDVAPRQRTLGIMLAYTPLHHLLLHDAGGPLVMTSGNRSDEPIAYRDEEVFAHLGAIADYFLVHDRPIHMRCDDTVVRVVAGSPLPVRRSRGYVPAPLSLPCAVERPVLGCGAEMKNTFCLAAGRRAFPGHYIGDLENYETYRSYVEGIEHFCRLFDLRPQVLACDLHPDYLSTRYAREREEGEGIPVVGVQHHQAHIAACLADNGRPADEEVIGAALDGTGYGTDGAIWGGEFFTGSVRCGFARRLHLAYLPMPGGTAAIRQPWRMAVAALLPHCSVEEIIALPLPFVRAVGEQRIRLAAQMVRAGVNTSRTSSAGRLFDVVAALAGVPGSLATTYEGQAAVELELAAATGGHVYPFTLCPADGGGVIETDELIGAILADLLAGRTVGEVAANFHRTMAAIVLDSCRLLRGDGGPNRVVLSGGTFQNVRLLTEATNMLAADGFTVYRHHHVPTNDGGLSLGQVVMAGCANGCSG